MNQLLRPKLTIPPQLSVSESGSFARYTFTHRVPAIIHQVIAENNYDDSIVNQLEALAQNLLQEQVCSLDNDGGTDLAAWTEYIAPHKAKYWLDAPFYFIESYFYRRLLQITAYFSLKPEQKIDPFELQKRLDLVKSMKLVRLEVQQHRQSLSDSADKQDPSWQQTLMNLLYLNLWGNRADLSLKPTRAGDFNHEQMSTQPQTESIILNDAAQVVNYLSQGNQQRIDFIVDNAGWELISDLLLVDFLLASNAVNVVHLHLKGHPIFVSDAMIKDVEETIDLLAKDQETAVREFATSLQNHLASGRLILQDHPFWTSPLFFWSIPQELRSHFAQSSLVFIKGDANYRRLVGDCHWAKTAVFSDICCYFPTSLVTLRTLKSEVIVGLEENQIKQLDCEDSQWLTNGTKGLIQFWEIQPFSVE